MSHPEGARYFFHEEKVCSCFQVPIGIINQSYPQRILTDANLNEPPVLSLVQRVVRDIYSYIDTHSIRLPSDPSNIDLVIDFTSPGDVNSDVAQGAYYCGYYFADHEHQCLFWLDDYDIEDILIEVKVEMDASHVGEAFRSCTECIF